MIDKETEYLCNLAWQEKFLELKGLKIGDRVICGFSTSHGNAKHSYSSTIDGEGVIVSTEKGIMVKSTKKYSHSKEQKDKPWSTHSYWVYFDDYVYSELRYIRNKVEQ